MDWRSPKIAWAIEILQESAALKLACISCERAVYRTVAVPRWHRFLPVPRSEVASRDAKLFEKLLSYKQRLQRRMGVSAAGLQQGSAAAVPDKMYNL